MAYLAVIVGSTLVLLILADTFFTVLNYNQRGIFFNQFLRLQWKGIHRLARRLDPERKRHLYRVLTGLTLVAGITFWVVGMVGGFALVYLAAIDLGSLTVDAGAPGGLAGATYYSLGQFSTVGSNGITPAAAWVSLASVVETLLSVMLLSLVITFLINIFGSIESLRTLCACFPSTKPYVTSSYVSLKPFIPREDPASLEQHLVNTRTAMNSYFDSIASDHSAAYFYSGKDRFIMPFAVYMLAGTVEGLGYGLPEQHPMSRLPELVRFKASLANCREQIYTLLRWPEPVKSAPLDQTSFVLQAKAAASTDPALRNDHYVDRFVTLRETMSAMDLNPAPTDWSGEYERYCSWVSFATIYDDFIARTSRFFDYHPDCDPRLSVTGIPVARYGWTKSDRALSR